MHSGLSSPNVVHISERYFKEFKVFVNIKLFSFQTYFLGKLKVDAQMCLKPSVMWEVYS